MLTLHVIKNFSLYSRNFNPMRIFQLVKLTNCYFTLFVNFFKKIIHTNRQKDRYYTALYEEKDHFSCDVLYMHVYNTMKTIDL